MVLTDRTKNSSDREMFVRSKKKKKKKLGKKGFESGVTLALVKIN